MVCLWSATGSIDLRRNGLLMGKVERLGQARLGPQPLAQAAGVAALSMDSSYYESVRGIWAQRVNCLYELLNDIPGVQHNKPAGAFYTMVQLPVDNTEHFARYLIEDFRLQTDSGPTSLIVAPGGWLLRRLTKRTRQIRLAAVLEEPKIALAIDVLKTALERYNR